MHDSMVMTGGTPGLVPALVLTFAVLFAILVKNVSKFRVLGIPTLLLIAVFCAHLGPVNPLLGEHATHMQEHPCCMIQQAAIEPFIDTVPIITFSSTSPYLYEGLAQHVARVQLSNKSPPALFFA